MSLKAFHVVFIIASILLALGFGGWCLSTYNDGGMRQYLIAAVASGVVALGMLVYGVYFLKKLKKIDYL
jgi:hypothetical protein